MLHLPRQDKEQIYICAKAFRTDANALMLQLAEQFDFNIKDCGAWPVAVYKTSRINKGKLNEEWTFYLHGSHCRFENINTGQSVEVLYTEKPEFGYLDGYFFFNYMQTTERFKHLASLLINYSNVYRAIEELAEEGILAKTKGNYHVNRILAL